MNTQAFTPNALDNESSRFGIDWMLFHRGICFLLVASLFGCRGPSAVPLPRASDVHAINIDVRSLEEKDFSREIVDPELIEEIVKFLNLQSSRWKRIIHTRATNKVTLTLTTDEKNFYFRILPNGIETGDAFLRLSNASQKQLLDLLDLEEEDTRFTPARRNSSGPISSGDT